MRHSSRPVTVSIVSHGHWDHIHGLLQQLSDWCGPSIERVILTLNLPERVRIEPSLAFPVDVVRNVRPRGFGANHNTAFARSATPWFLVVNPDIRIDGDVLSPLLGVAESDAALLTPRVQEPGRDAPEPFRPLATPPEVFRRFVLRRRDDPPPPVPSWVAGMFMLVRSEAYRQVRGFDERFFMYCEDVDLCIRLQLADWNLQVADDLVVHHEAQRDSHTSMRAFVWHFGSLLKLWTSRRFWEFRALEKGWMRRAHVPSVRLCHARAAGAHAAESEL